ncbi:MAG TPA: RNA polymerase sigma factor [Steroidobacteraceae bacterium]|nr:RNA polymerase sigma factor [Steroidobacteraceae bacterium]
MTDPAGSGEAAAELVTRASRGDAGAFEALYRQHAGRVYGLCLRMTGHPQSAEDLTQDTFVSAWRSLPGYEGRSSFSTWLHRIAVNAVLAKRRSPQGRNEVSMTDDSGEQMDFEAETVMDDATPIDVERAIAALPSGARDIVVLHGVYGYSHEEAADMLGVAVGTCKAQLHRARRLMRARMGGEAGA